MRYKAGLETRDRIIAATRKLIANGGMESTTIKSICDEAEVLPGSFYNLFSSKEEAILTVVADAIEAVDPDPDHEGTESLEDLVNAYVRFLLEDPVMARVYIRTVLSGLDNEKLKARAIRHHESRVDRFQGAIARLDPSASQAEAATRAETLVTALNGVALHVIVDPGFDVATHSAALSALVSLPRDTDPLPI